MSQLEAAQQRLTAALRRLESALTQHMMKSASGAPGDLERRLAAIAAERSMLRAECDRLSAALSKVQREHRHLREVTGQVAGRIDGSITEIDRLLEG